MDSDRRMDSVRRDREVLEEVVADLRAERVLAAGRPASGRAPGRGWESVRPAASEEDLERLVGPEGGLPYAGMEAIVLLRGRPSLLVRNGTFEVPRSRVWGNRLLPAKPLLDAAIAGVGRLDLYGHDTYEWVGTAWMVSDDTAVTNRHVALAFAEKGPHALAFARNAYGRRIGASVDFRREVESASRNVVRVDRILHIEPPGSASPDLALLQVSRSSSLPEAIRLGADPVRPGSYVAVIGYPMRDPRNDAEAQDRIFGDQYGVKRLAPGTVARADRGATFFTHDASTLGGNSGSVVVDVESGRAIGLHFGGQFRAQNFAVRAPWIEKALRRVRPRVSLEGARPRGPVGPTRPARYYRGRKGYDPGFLGRKASHRVLLPGLRRWRRDVPRIRGADRHEPHVLAYEHFSVVMSKSRRLPLFTAVNIDGKSLRGIPRAGNRWYLDGRLAKAFQVGNEGYLRNRLDRGHMVRRQDPVWGPSAALANEDTFHYTNSSPQHELLNQRTWVSLEDYVLDNAHARDLAVSVFTGPVFRPNDPAYRGLRLPTEFWKVAVLVNADTGKLSATGYLLSQRGLLHDLDEAAFVYGAFRTYQLPITEIERRSGLDFGNLPRFDPKRGEDEVESPIGIAGARLVQGPEDLVF